MINDRISDRSCGHFLTSDGHNYHSSTASKWVRGGRGEMYPLEYSSPSVTLSRSRSSTSAHTLSHSTPLPDTQVRAHGPPASFRSEKCGLANVT